MIEISKLVSQFDRWKELILQNNELKETTIQNAQIENGWFTPLEIERMLNSIQAQFLDSERLKSWLNTYEINNSSRELSIGLIAAGNIPLVSFHDIFCLLISGHQLQIKLSDKDKILPFWLLNLFSNHFAEYKSKINYVDQLKNYDAVIATGGEIASNHFNYYFKDSPKLIRSHRNSIAILSGNESEQEVIQLGLDIFSYYGLGCRNVSKIYVPEGFDFPAFIEILDNHYIYVRQNNKYHNNYDYNLAIYTLNKSKFYQGESSLFLESNSISSRIACLNYEYYKDIDQLENELNNKLIQIQSIQSNMKFNKLSTFQLGDSQYPSLSDYADGIDTMKFLLQLS
ncbi:MAG: acyl-CoA reductase [Saprospiraceae bacterium]